MYFNAAKWQNDGKANFGQYRQCALTVMDTVSDPYITFDAEGVSNYYRDYIENTKNRILPFGQRETELARLVKSIKADAKGKRYDCITGASGGVDSTYLLYKAKELGLNPLVVHFDNGWNSELAVGNIENCIKKLEFDLYTVVVDWNEFKDLQLAYFKANVIDIEAITDHAIMACLYKTAIKHNLKYILSGNNLATEGILPRYWIHNKADSLNIKAIHREFGQAPLKTFPFISPYSKHFSDKVRNFEVVELLNFVNYNKEEVKTKITQELGWRDYGGKHYESVFTRFYQGYILPVKFGVDKRKAHLSSMICAGQLSKTQAIEALAAPIYDDAQLKIDREFVLKKLGFSEEWFETYLKTPRREHTEFDYYKGFYSKVPFLAQLRKMKNIVRKNA